MARRRYSVVIARTALGLQFCSPLPSQCIDQYRMQAPTRQLILALPPGLPCAASFRNSPDGASLCGRNHPHPLVARVDPSRLPRALNFSDEAASEARHAVTSNTSLHPSSALVVTARPPWLSCSGEVYRCSRKFLPSWRQASTNFRGRLYASRSYYPRRSQCAQRYLRSSIPLCSLPSL